MKKLVKEELYDDRHFNEMKDWGAIPITDEKRKQILYNAAIKTGEQMFGSLDLKGPKKGTYGGHFRFADKIEDCNFYDISFKDFKKIAGDAFSVNNFTFFPISNKPGILDNGIDIDGNMYVADDYDTVFEDCYKSSIWVIHNVNLKWYE